MLTHSNIHKFISGFKQFVLLLSVFVIVVSTLLIPTQNFSEIWKSQLSETDSNTESNSESDEKENYQENDSEDTDEQEDEQEDVWLFVEKHCDYRESKGMIYFFYDQKIPQVIGLVPIPPPKQS